MAKIDRTCLEAVKNAYEEYAKEVTLSGLSHKSKQTYTNHAEQFVRWLDDDFEPGGHLRRSAMTH